MKKQRNLPRLGKEGGCKNYGVWIRVVSDEYSADRVFDSEYCLKPDCYKIQTIAPDYINASRSMAFLCSLIFLFCSIFFSSLDTTSRDVFRSLAISWCVMDMRLVLLHSNWF
jgi:hypothetical protein